MRLSVDQALYQRKSIRAFTDAPVSRADIEALCTIAGRSPSGGNLQPWRVIAVNGEARQAVCDLAQRVLAASPTGEPADDPIYPPSLWEPYRSRRFAVGEALYASIGIARDQKLERLAQAAENFSFFGAPVGLFFIIDTGMGRGQWAHLGMMMQSLMLAAEARGLGTCPQEAWAMLRKSLHAHFALPDNELVYCGMAIGVPDRDAPINQWRSQRAPIADWLQLKGFVS